MKKYLSIPTKRSAVSGRWRASLMAILVSALLLGSSTANPLTVTAAEAKMTSYFGSQLTGLSLEIYQNLVADYATARKTGDSTCSFKQPLTCTISGDVNEDNVDNTKEYDQLTDEIMVAAQNAIDILPIDHPEVFWFKAKDSSFGYSFQKNGSGSNAAGVLKITSITLKPGTIYPNPSEAVKRYDQNVQNAVNTILSKPSARRSRYFLVKEIHDYVCALLKYEYKNDRTVNSAGAGFVGDRKAVCEGYSKTFKQLCDRLDVPCICVGGNARNPQGGEEAHMWNYVLMEDGKWYLVDTTWDDDDSGQISDDYLLVGSQTPSPSTEDETISSERTAKGSFSDSGHITFIYPTLSPAAYNLNAKGYVIPQGETNQAMPSSFPSKTDSPAAISGMPSRQIPKPASGMDPVRKPNRFPNKTAGNDSSQASWQIPEQNSDQASGQIPGQNSDQASGQIPDQNSDQASGQIPDQNSDQASGQDSSQDPSNAPGASEPLQTVPLSGGWDVAKARYSFLTSSQKKLFDKALKGLTGVSYRPVALLASQGKRYIYLCQGTTVTAAPERSWYILTLTKGAKLASINQMDVTSLQMNRHPRSASSRGTSLAIQAVKNKKGALSKDVRAIFNQALRGYTTYQLRPIALLGRQIVAGVNYRFLCYGTGRKAKDCFVLTVFHDLDNNTSISSCRPLNLEAYIG